MLQYYAHMMCLKYTVNKLELCVHFKYKINYKLFYGIIHFTLNVFFILSENVKENLLKVFIFLFFVGMEVNM